ncbi:MAG TPA: DUF6064 family protein, partial [Armatimonadota bacterium]|nr:DUF6064 family protein [Armatimonadota bacterium]
KTSSRIISATLGLFWVWMGIIYHIMHFSSINPIARLFGVLFVLQGILLVAVGCISDRLKFQFTIKPIPIIGALFIAYSMIVYPLIGTLVGHSYPRAPMFGVAPCPTTIFTLGLLLIASIRIPIYIVIIPLLWFVIATTAAVKLHVPQDFGLGVSAIIGIILILINNRNKKDKSISTD